jgi:TorA maturation chaperone TorD
MLEAENDPDASVSEEELLRARIYNLLGRLLTAPADAALLRLLGALPGDDTEFGKAVGALSRAARAAAPAALAEEFQELFIGVGRGELVPYGSYYLTGFLHEKPLADLRADMAKLGIALADDVSEPEDHIAALCESMAGLITGAFGGPASLLEQRRFFAQHMAPWAARFFADLEGAKAAEFYRPVGVIGRLFMDVESNAFAMAGEGSA